MPKLASILPKKAVQIYGLIDVVFNKLRYDPHLAMEDLGCISIYVGDVLAVSPKARGLGLAGELVKR